MVIGAEGGVRDARLRSGDGAEFTVVTARPGSGDRTIGDGTGVVILPDIRGLGQPYVDLARRFAAEGMSAISERDTDLATGPTMTKASRRNSHGRRSAAAGQA